MISWHNSPSSVADTSVVAAAVGLVLLQVLPAPVDAAAVSGSGMKPVVMVVELCVEFRTIARCQARHEHGAPCRVPLPATHRCWWLH
jgi:hypothetical protein